MLIDGRTLDDGTRLQADLCILGGGAVGIAIAREFLGTGTDVVVVEGGGLEHEDDSQALYQGEGSGLRYFELDDSRCRLFGGSTYRWGARGAPMNPIDFRTRPWVKWSGWPFAPDQLGPYYARAEALMGVNSPFSYDGGVWDAFDATPPPLDDSLLRYQAFQFGKNLLFGELYRPELERADNVRVLLHGNVVNLQAAVGADHLEHVDLSTLEGRRLRITARRFVLACGGIENPRLLLLSTGVDSRGLCNARDQVGRYFMEHPTATAGTVVTSDVHGLLDLFSPGLIAGRLIEIGLAISDSVQEERGCLNAVAAVKPNLAPDATQALREILWDLSHHRELREGFVDRLKQMVADPMSLAVNTYRHATGKPKRFSVESLFLELRTEQEPNPDSRVTLADSKDALGLPRAHLHWTLSERDRLTMQVLAEIVDSELGRLGLGRLEPGGWLRREEHEFSDDLVGGHHHMGTTRMSDSDVDGVVDADCRAHAIDNLWIAGSSVFCTAGYVNPTPTALALALRLADHLKA